MSRKNGRHKLPRHTPEPKSPVLVALEQRLEKAERKLVEAVAYTDDLVSGWERERDEILNGGRLAGRLGARKDGDNWPYLTTMEDLVAMRAASREACEGNGYGAGMLDRAVDFVVGDGMQPEVTLIGVKKGAVATGVADADGDGRPDADPAVENVMGVIEEFRRLNDWGMGEEDREEEGFRRSQRDGEVFVRFFAVGNTNGIPLVRWVEPEQVEAPPGGSEWRWGIKYRKINGVPDVESKEAVYVRTPDGTDGDWVPMREVVYHKLGTDRTVLRGMPQFWLVARALYQSDALNSALAEVSAIQAKIAYVREHAPGIMPGQITDFVGGTGDGMGVKRTMYGDKYRRTGISEEGTIVDMTYGTKFGAGPVSTGVPAFVQALQSRLRQVCARFGYPEFFTGDASNNNYASSLTAGGPAEKAFKRKQHKYAAFQAAVYRRACEYAVADGRLSAADLAAVEIKVRAGGVAIANKLEEAQVQQIRIQNKTLSPQTAMVENGHDPKVEMANIKAFDDQFGMGAMGMGGGGEQIDGGQLLEPITGESYTQEEYQLLSEAARAGLTLKQVGTHPRTGKPIMRYVRATPKVDPRQQKAAQKAAAMDAARKIVQRGIKTPKDARDMAAHLKLLTAKEIDALKAEHGLKMKGRLKQDKVDSLVAYAQGRGSIDTVQAKPEPAAPKAEPKAEPTPATPPPTPTPPPPPQPAQKTNAGLPDVPADAATDPQKYEQQGKAILNNQAVRQAIVDAADHLSQFVEYQHELYPMPRMYREVSKRVPGLTVAQFQAAMWQASQDRALELHAVNEVRNYPDAEKQGSIKTSDRLYQFVRMPQNATADALKPKE